MVRAGRRPGLLPQVERWGVRVRTCFRANNESSWHELWHRTPHRVHMANPAEDRLKERIEFSLLTRTWGWLFGFVDLIAGEVAFAEIFVTPSGQSKGCG